MSKQRIEDCYFEHNSTIFSEMLGEDENYQRLKKAKRAAEEALQSVISKEAWKQYLALDEICNELECARYKAMYLAGAAAYRNQHRTARVAALGTLFIWHRITLLSGMQKPPKVTLAAVLVSISCYYYNTGGMYQTRPFFICQAKAPVLFGAF